MPLPIASASSSSLLRLLSAVQVIVGSESARGNRSVARFLDDAGRRLMRPGAGMRLALHALAPADIHLRVAQHERPFALERIGHAVAHAPDFFDFDLRDVA